MNAESSEVTRSVDRCDSGSLICPVMSTIVEISHITEGTGSATTVGTPLASLNPSVPADTCHSPACPLASTVRERMSYHPADISRTGETTYSLPSLFVPS